jgi:hypothetical protein
MSSDQLQKMHDQLIEQGQKNAKKAKAETFLTARARILDELRGLGWNVVAFNAREGKPMKVPHATSPDGGLRLWFKPQAVWFTKGNRHELGEARTISYDLDIRNMPAARLVEIATR